MLPQVRGREDKEPGEVQKVVTAPCMLEHCMALAQHLQLLFWRKPFLLLLQTIPRPMVKFRDLAAAVEMADRMELNFMKAVFEGREVGFKAVQGMTEIKDWSTDRIDNLVED